MIRNLILAAASVALVSFGIWAGGKLNGILHGKGCINLSGGGGFAEGDFLKLRNPSVVRFAALGDVGTGKDGQKLVAAAMKRVCDDQGCDFVLLLGDSVYPEGLRAMDDPRFEAVFEEPYAPLGLPFLPVLGNHDVKYPAVYLLAQSARTPNWRMPDFEYAFRAGPARFFAINTNCSLATWWKLTDRLAESSSGWTIVYGHHSIYSTGPHGDTDTVQEWVWKYFLEDRVDFYLAGHNHLLERLNKPEAATEYIVSGGGAGESTYGRTGRSGQPAASAANNRFRHTEGGFTWFEISAARALVRFYDAEGRLLYQFTKERGGSG